MNKVRQMISEQTMPCEDCGERGYRDKTDPNLFLCDHCRHERLEIGKKAKIENALFDSHNDNNDK
jgi:Zn finger protein HypA/HybF involved in hydrogenase expression